ncbi:hypothetical protein ACHAXH_000373, partial [Discostella pseudostelligera]
MDCHLFTTKIVLGYAKIAKEVIQFSGMEDIISLHEISYNSQDTDIVILNVLFIDHDNNAYKSDLRKLEASGMIRRGTRVVADNVLFACIDDYVQYM